MTALAVPVEGTGLVDFQSIRDLPERVLDMLEQFFENYNRAEGKRFRSLGRKGAHHAMARIAKLRT